MLPHRMSWLLLDDAAKISHTLPTNKQKNKLSTKTSEEIYKNTLKTWEEEDNDNSKWKKEISK